MRYVAAVCDDQMEIREQLTDYFGRLSKESGDIFSVMTFESGEDCLANMPDDTQLLLLDIMMDGASGIDIGIELRRRSSQLCIIYITSEASYALDSYRARAFNYIMKPVSYETFKDCISEALKIAVKKGNRFIIVSKGTSTDKIFFKEILYIESSGHNITIFTRTGARTYTRPLKSVERELDPSQFVRCHQGFVVNLSHIRRIGMSDIEMADRSKVPLSRHRKKDVQEKFALFAAGI